MYSSVVSGAGKEELNRKRKVHGVHYFLSTTSEDGVVMQLIGVISSVIYHIEEISKAAIAPIATIHTVATPCILGAWLVTSSLFATAWHPSF